MPHISENLNKPEKIKSYIHYKRPKILLFGFGCLAIAWLIIPTFLNLLYHGKYDDAALTIRVLIIGNAVFLYTVMYFPLLGAMKLYKFLQIINITQVIINIILSVLLIPKYNILGAAVAAVISYIYLAIATELYYRHTIKKALV